MASKVGIQPPEVSGPHRPVAIGQPSQHQRSEPFPQLARLGGQAVQLLRRESSCSVGVGARNDI